MTADDRDPRIVLRESVGTLALAATNRLYAEQPELWKLGEHGRARTLEDFEPFLVRLRTAKPQIFALYDELPDMSEGYRKNARSYLDEFFRAIDRPRDVKRAFVDGCNGRIGSDLGS